MNTMKFFALAALCATFSVVADASVFRWVGADGTIHYGDKPPEKQNSSHSVLNDQGLVMDEVNQPETNKHTVDESALESKRKQQALLFKAQRRDNILLQTFTTERDLLATRDNRLASMDSNIELSRWRIETWDQRVREIEKMLEEYQEGSAPSALLEEREDMLSRIARSRNYLDEQLRERKEIEAQFEKDLKRYREIKADSAN